jgi:3,4-dihydroxy 2-butanone 4-phosphate synthase
MNPDGTMARGAQVAQYALQHGLLCTTVEAITDFRRRLGRSGPARPV